MKKIIFINITFLTVCMTGFVQAQTSNNIMITGKILDFETEESVPGVHVINKHSGTVSDVDGNFSLQINVRDSLLFSMVGYDHKLVVFDDSVFLETQYNMIIHLHKSTTQLQPVDVFAFKSETDFKNAVIALQLPKAEKLNINVPGYYNGPTHSVKPGVGSPISFIADKIGKRAKMERKFNRTRQTDIRRHQFDAKFNKEIVSRITGLKDQQLDDFMNYCSLSESFVLKSNEYEIIVAINNCYKNYLSNN